jgi:hypothetical protein
MKAICLTLSVLKAGIILLVALLAIVPACVAQTVTWTQVGDALHPFLRAGSGVLGNYMYCFGTTWPQDSGSAQAFNLTTEQWEESTRPPVGKGNFSSVTTDDAIYLIGSRTYVPVQYLADVQRFTPTGGGPTGTWTALHDYPLAIPGMAVAWDGGNYIYAAGGTPNDTIWYPYAYKYDITNDTWTQIADAPVPLLASGGAFLYGKFYVAGGWATGTDDQLLEYDPNTDTWAFRTGPPVPVAFPAFSTTQDAGRMFVIGGGGATPHSPVTGAVQNYDPLTDTWTQETSLPVSNVSGSSARFVAPDKVICAGGITYPGWLCVTATYRGTGFPNLSVPIGQPLLLPSSFCLSANPNPFNPITVISYTLPQAGPISLRVYDILGRQIAVLVDGFSTPGTYRTTFDGTQLSSGIYFVLLQAGNLSQTCKMVLLK